MFVKICGLRTKDDVAAAVDAGADAVGFVFHPKSVRNIEPANAMNAAAGIPRHVQRVAVMRHPSNDEWQSVLRGFDPEVLQTDADDFESLDVPEHIECWPVHREKVTGPIRLSRKGPVTFLFEGAQSGAGETVDWVLAAEAARNGRMILAGGLDASNVAEAITTARPFGVDVSSGVESAPGVKDATLIREFVTAAKAAGRNL